MRCVDTGADTPTGGRLWRVREELAAGPFMATYADGVADIDLAALRGRHEAAGTLGAVTVVRPELPFGVALLGEDGRVAGFHEKPRAEHWVNGGFFSFEPAALTYLREDSVLEREPLERMAADGELAAFRHEGFWACMDTYKDAVALNDLWAGGDAPVGRGPGAPVLDFAAMAGHSKWAGIKHKKAIVDSRRGKLFTKLARAITVAAKEGGGDIEGNPSLALAVQKAKDASMPKDNIERAIAKGTGEGGDADALEAVMYEGYGPGGVALLVEATTDNRNRTGSEVRHAFGKHNGNLGEPGSVAYLFDKQGVVVVDAERYSEDDLMVAIDAGAEDIAMDDDVFEVITEPSALTAVRAALDEAGIAIENAEVAQRPKTLVPLDEEGATKLMRLIDALEDLDDVDAVHANFDVPADVLERVAG